MTTKVALAVFAYTSSVLAIMQANVPPGTDVGTIGQVERLGLVGVLILAVGILWRKLEAKDEIQAKTQVAAAEALIMNTEVMRELKESVSTLSSTVTGLNTTVDRMMTVRDTLDSRRPRD